MPRAHQDIADAGGLLAVLRNGHHDGTVEIDARREAADQIERLRGLVRQMSDVTIKATDMAERAFQERDRLREALIQIRVVCEDNPNMATNFIDELACLALTR